MNEVLQQLEASAVRREVKVLGLAALYVAGRHDMAVAHNARRRRRRAEEEVDVVRPWLRRREQFGCCESLKVELENEDPRQFKNMLRMEPAMFHELEARLTT